MGFLNTEGLYIKIKCKECKKEGIIEAFALVSTDLQILNEIPKKDFRLPLNWVALDWWSKLKIQDKYPENENVSDSGFFCSRSCLLKFFGLEKKNE